MAEIIFFVAAFLAVVAGTLAGFGSSTVFLPVALFFYDFTTALVLTAILHIAGNASKIALFKEGLNKKLVVRFGLPSVLFTIIGASLIIFVQQAWLFLLLGIFLVYFSLTKWFGIAPKYKATPQNAILGGAISGFLAGIIGTGGAIRGAFLTAFNLDKKVYIATAAAIAFVVDLTRIPIYLYEGLLPESLYMIVPILIVLALAGAYTGKKLVQQVSQQLFQKIVLVAIFLAALKFIVDGSAGLF